MKKLLLILLFAVTAMTSKAQLQEAVTLSTFTQVQRIDNKWQMTLPLVINYAIVQPINDRWFYGGGVGIGFNFSEKATSNVTVPVMGFFGGQFLKNFPAIALGGGLDANTADPFLAINLNFYIFKGGEDGTQRKASPQYRSIVGNDDYARDGEAGFNRKSK